MSDTSEERRSGLDGLSQGHQTREHACQQAQVRASGCLGPSNSQVARVLITIAGNRRHVNSKSTISVPFSDGRLYGVHSNVLVLSKSSGATSAAFELVHLSAACTPFFGWLEAMVFRWLFFASFGVSLVQFDALALDGSIDIRVCILHYGLY